MATIKDVAREAGVSPSTVSRTLHDSSLISRETKEKIWQAMKKLNYSPNFAAQNLANNTSNIIGVILPPNEESVANNPFFGQILQGGYDRSVINKPIWYQLRQARIMLN